MFFQVLMFLFCGALMIVVLLSFVATADRRDIKNATPGDWLENAKNRTCSNMYGTGVVTETEEAFEKIRGISNTWEELYGKKRDFLSGQDEAEQLFKITAENIEIACSDFKNERCSKEELIAEFDYQISLLNELLRDLANVVSARNNASFAK